jgi:hypothetical protein
MSLARFLRLGALVAALAAAAPSLEAQKSYTRITRDEMMSLVRDEGFGSVETRDDKTFTTKMEGYKVAFFILSDGESVQAYFGRTGTGARLAGINEWNKTKRYSRAYLDDDGDPVLELDLDLAGGVTAERIKDYIRTVKLSVARFSSEVK